MEDQIFKRLQMIYPVTTMDNSRCAAKEIDTLTHNHYMEFIKWKDKECFLNKPSGCYRIRKDIYRGNYNLDKLYQFWQTNKL